MKVAELSDLLTREGYCPRHCTFNRETPPAEGYVLEKVASRWVVFYFERGKDHDVANFLYESDACKYFYETMHKGYSSVVKKVLN